MDHTENTEGTEHTEGLIYNPYVVNFVDNINILYHAEVTEIAERTENKGNYYVAA